MSFIDSSACSTFYGVVEGATIAPLDCHTFFPIDRVGGWLEGISLKLFARVEDVVPYHGSWVTSKEISSLNTISKTWTECPNHQHKSAIKVICSDYVLSLVLIEELLV